MVPLHGSRPGNCLCACSSATVPWQAEEEPTKVSHVKSYFSGWWLDSGLVNEQLMLSVLRLGWSGRSAADLTAAHMGV